MKTPLTLFLLFFAITVRASAFDVVLMDDPAIHLVFDRKYEVLQINKKGEKTQPGHLMYMMSPADDQSAVTLAIGEGFHPKTEKMIADMFEGAKVKKADGVIGQYKVQWWHYRDSHHLYSTCVFKVKWHDKPEWPVIIDLIANSQGRLDSLEDSFSKILMVENPPNKSPVPTATSLTLGKDR